jgi:hypothetical protein
MFVADIEPEPNPPQEPIQHESVQERVQLEFIQNPNLLKPIHETKSSQAEWINLVVDLLSYFSLKTHTMMTRIQDGTKKPKTYLACRYPLPKALIAELVQEEKESVNFTKAQQDSSWIQVMQEDIDVIHRTKTWTLVPPKPNYNLVLAK